MKVAIHKACFCPFCRSEIGISPELILCSDCKTLYHRECWNEHRGCSVFGCTGVRKLFPTRPNFENGSESGLLMFLRMVVFGFIPYTLLAISTKAGPWTVFGCLGLFWFLLFLPCLPALFVLEVVYLKRVLRNPELQPTYGDRAYHVLSLSAYAIGATAILVTFLLNS